MKLFSLTTLAVVAAAAYICHTVWVMYGMWNPKQCTSAKKGTCLLPYNPPKAQWNLNAYWSKRKERTSLSNLVWNRSNIDLQQQFSEKIVIPLPKVRKLNTELDLHVILYRSGKSETGEFSVHKSMNITKYSKPLKYFKLVNDKNETVENEASKDMVLHWRSQLTVNVMQPPFTFDLNEFPGEIGQHIKQTKSGKYLPVLFIDELAFLKSDLKEVKEDMPNITIEISYSPISIGKLRLWTVMLLSMEKMVDLGFTEEDTEQVRGLFTDTNIWLLSLTFFVSTFHLLFEFLAFKHDIVYWKERKTMEGLSQNTVMYRCISTIIIFLYLMDEKTSYIVLVPAGIGSIIEIWKVTKALKVKVFSTTGWRFWFSFGSTTTNERATENYDHQAIKYLSYVLYPLSVGCAVYSLFYVPQKSWYSWVINSLVNGVYAFGFLFMLPQLFINYKLKSVAHLPWKAFTYKAFNTFIDDLFAFIIKMPTSHRIACFRDDVVFFCYLFQRWQYPVDKTRANEYGISYDEEKKEN